MERELRATAQCICNSLPLSLEMPAGTGKTHLVAAIATIAAETSKRTLILTHTHSGVDAIRRRLNRFGVSSRAVHVDTITGWAFDLARSYPLLAGTPIPAVPDWSRSAEYIAGATRVAGSSAIRDMHSVSFDYFIVDEYQDCNQNQHRFLLEIARAIPLTCVLGDRLQGIFRFRNEAPLVDWDVDVSSRFPPHAQTFEAQRWKGHNEVLGEWLLSIRPGLLLGLPLDLSAISIAGLTWKTIDSASIVGEALRSRPPGESVLLLGKWAADLDDLGRNLRGVYEVMEELQGKFMIEFLSLIDNSPATDHAFLLAQFAKKCFTGLAGIDAAVLRKLESGVTISHLSRPGIEVVQQVLDSILTGSSLDALANAMGRISRAPNLKLFKREAWNDSRTAIENASGSEDISALEAFGRIRDSIRHRGRRIARRSVSRTLLVKGLEFDHVIIADADRLKDYANLYVALTRSRKTVTVFSRRSIISL